MDIDSGAPGIDHDHDHDHVRFVDLFQQIDNGRYELQRTRGQEIKLEHKINIWYITSQRHNSVYPILF